MSEIVAIGQRDQIIGFQGVGVKIAPAKDHAQFAAGLKEVARRDDVGIILVTENFAEDEGADLIAQIRKTYGKVILVIPDHHGSKGLAYRKMQKDVERALGVDLLGKG